MTLLREELHIGSRNKCGGTGFESKGFSEEDLR
jgi:hypothetical protein